ncbi:organic solute transporter subunit alpha-like [Gigantopelta aegis]|uniref:organic solute transporter subunit alpha-like n=1 Tax=Gigantopelta aegis TaxID=1735272 RepID=UPI001B88BA5C|nr:organic solute transporter subunit alpha-like [Gigantopelta aegis]
MGQAAVSNATACTATEILPFAIVYFKELTIGEMIGVAVCCGLTLLIVAMFIENVIFLLKNLTCKRTLNLSVYQIGIHPIFASLALLAVVVPRSSLLCDLVGSVYLSLCINVFLRLIVTYHGGSERMLARMSQDKIPLRSPPLACCCCCCPTITITRRNFNRIRVMVVQVTFVRPVVMFIAAALWTDGRYTKGGFSGAGAASYINVISSVSTLTAMYGLILVYRASRKHLANFHLMPKFINLQLVLMFSSLQQLIFTTLQKYNLPSCRGHLSTPALGNAMNHMILIGEMFLLAILARCYYRRREGEPITIAEIGSDGDNDRNKLKQNGNSPELTAIDGVYRKLDTEEPVVHTIAQ